MNREYEVESDHELLLHVREGDHQAFGELVARYAGRLSWFFAVQSRDKELAEDLTQETFVRVWRARTTYTPSGTAAGYLFRIARNVWLNWKRDACRRPESSLTTGDDALAVAAAEASTQPLEALLAKERQRRVEAAIDDLPEPLRLVFLLSHYENMKYADIAEALHIPVGTVKWRMHEAVYRLREKLRDLDRSR